MIKNIKWLLLVSLTFVACNNDDAVINPDSSDGMALTAGSANFSKYVALGDSFAAGYSDSALFIEGQKGAYPNILSQQFALVGGGAFTTPFMADNIGGFSMGGVQIPQFGVRLYFNPVTSGPSPVDGVTTTSITAKLTGQFNNMGIPGAKSFHLVTPSYAGMNPYFGRFASNTGTKVLTDATDQNATFFSLWIGGNDVLTYATSGGIGVNQGAANNTDASSYGSNDITHPAVFAGAYNALVTGLTAKGAKGVVANLPYVSTLPFFTTVPTSPFTPTALGGAVGIGQINGLYSLLRAALGAGDADRVKLLDATKASPVLIIDESLVNKSAEIRGFLTVYFGLQGDPNAAANAAAFGMIFGQARQAAAGDYVLLSTRSVLGATVAGAPSSINKSGVTYPLQDQHVLTADEALQVKVATDAFNVTIKTVADSKGLAFLDTKAVMDKLVNGGITANGYTLTSAYATGGAFSLDGIHPSPRGYALIANKFVEAINMTYGSNLKGVDLSKYRIMFPKVL